MRSPERWSPAPQLAARRVHAASGGSVTTKRAPFWSPRLSAFTVPPCSSTRLRTMVAEPEPALQPAGAVALREALEHLIEERRVDPLAGVGHDDARRVAGAGLDPHLDLAAVG